MVVKKKAIRAKRAVKTANAAKPAAKRTARPVGEITREKLMKKRVSLAAAAALKAFASLAGKTAKVVRGKKQAGPAAAAAKAKPVRKRVTRAAKPAAKAPAKKTAPLKQILPGKRVGMTTRKKPSRAAIASGVSREHRPLKMVDWSWTAPLPKKVVVIPPAGFKKKEKERHKKRRKKLGFLSRQRQLKAKRRTKKAKATKTIASVPVPAAAAVAASPAPAPSRRKPFVDWGLPIPDRYGMDRLQAMIRDPESVFTYWEMSGTKLAELRRQYGEGLLGGSSWHLVGRNPRDRSRQFRASVDPRRGTYYCKVRPETTIQFALVLRLPDGREIDVLVSNLVGTSRLIPSSRTDEEWFISEEEFGKFLEGYEPPVGSRGRPSFPGFKFTLPSSGGSRR